MGGRALWTRCDHVLEAIVRDKWSGHLGLSTAYPAGGEDEGVTCRPAQKMAVVKRMLQ